MAQKPKRLFINQYPFELFEFTEPHGQYGWGCSLKPGTTPPAALSAATEVARYALVVMQAKREHGERIEPNEWFHKADMALFTVTTKREIRDALYTARVDVAKAASEVELIDLLGILAGNWHDWVLKAVEHFAEHGVLSGSCAFNSLEDISLRLLVEAARAHKLIAIQKPNRPGSSQSHQGNNVRVSKNDLVCEFVHTLRTKSPPIKWDTLPQLVKKETGEDMTAEALQKAYGRWKQIGGQTDKP